MRMGGSYMKIRNICFIICLSAILVIITCFIKIKYVSVNSNVKQIETELYTISVPDNFQVKHTIGNMLEFYINNKNIGGLNALNYYPDQPEYQLDPNHSILVSTSKLKNMNYETLLKKYEISQPAASNDTTIKYQTHIFFIFQDKKLSYDLFFYTPDINDNTILDIGKSFKIK